MQYSLKEQVKAELLAGNHSFNIHPQPTGYVGEMALIELDTHDIEFNINGHLLFSQENKSVDTEEPITVEPQLYISGISVYKKEEPTAIENEDFSFDREISEVLLSKCLNKNW